MEHINPAQVGYIQNTNQQNFIDDKFIKDNPDCWKIINYFQIHPF